MILIGFYDLNEMF